MKLITYTGGYLQQDKGASEGTKELQAGLKLIQKGFNLIVKKSEPYIDDEKYTLYGLFDGLNFLFGLSEYKVISPMVNDDLFTGLLKICTLDQNEQELFEKSESSNDFYQLQSGANRKHYKEFAYAFIGDIIKHSEAT